MCINIGKILKERRKIAGLSVKEVFNSIKSAGFEVASISSVYAWENNNSRPSIEIFLFLCELYGINDIIKTFGFSFNGNIQKNNIDYIILRNINNLNENGKSKVLEYSEDIMSTGLYNKETNSSNDNGEKYISRFVAKGGATKDVIIDRSTKDLLVEEIMRISKELNN